MGKEHRFDHDRTAADEPARQTVSPGKRTRTQSHPGQGRPQAPHLTNRAVAADRTTRSAAELAAMTSFAVQPYGAAVVAQRKAAGPASGSELPAAGGGMAMPQAVQAKMEWAFGADFSAVRIHEGPRAAALGARAYTQGTDLHFAPGEYQPHSERGQTLLGHELAHVLQQSQGRVSATTQAKGVGINDDAALEREADEMGAKAARGEKVGAAGGSAHLAHATGSAALQPLQRWSAGNVIQRDKREMGDLDYGFSGPRHTAMLDAQANGQDARGGVSPTVDHLNLHGGITKFMEDFKFHDLLAYLGSYDKKVADQSNDKDKHVVAWVRFLKSNIARIDLSKQVAAATAGVLPGEATKDRLNKNKHRKLGAPDTKTILDWYNSKIIPGDDKERERLHEWVWNAFFRLTSKLGIEFTRDQGGAIHFNISKDAYGRALAGRKTGAKHSRNAITHSELRHLKKLHDRGHAPAVHFQDNGGGVHDVAAPFGSLDLLDGAGVRRLYRTAAWKQESVAFETRLGTYLANSKPEAKNAVQAGLTKMDALLAKHNGSKNKSGYQEHRKVFGKRASSSAGQVGEDHQTVRSVIKGTAQLGEDPINMREQMTAFYNAGLWNAGRGTTIKKVLTEAGQIEDKSAREDAASKLGISAKQINDVHAIMRSQIKATRAKIDRIKRLPRQDRLDAVKNDLGLKGGKAQKLVDDIHGLNKERRAYRNEKDSKTQKEKKATYLETRWELAKAHTKFNILETTIDTDTSRPARLKRDDSDRDAHKKSSQDYTDLGVPLSNREKASVGGVMDEAAKLPWVEGLAYFKIDETTGWGKEMKKKGFPTVAGNSGTAARLMNIYVWLDAGAPLDFRLALMGWMLPCRDHSLMEIMQGTKAAGVTGPGETLDSPVDMYKNIAPLTASELRAHAGKDGLFPEERVLRTVDDVTYKSLIKQK